MNEAEYRVVEDPEWGYRRLEPLPSRDDLSRFYESGYCDLVSQGRRGPDLKRLMADDEEAAEERRWLASTLYGDILSVLEEHLPSQTDRRGLDVGCGTGEFLAFLQESGWAGVGLEPTPEIASVARRRGAEVHALTLGEYVEERRADARGGFDLVSFLNVLEHVPDPVALLRRTEDLLRPGGVVVLRVPNDFSPLQRIAQESLGKDPWWIAIPDHVNYFTYDSLEALLGRLGLEVLHRQGDFPMELFLLMGDDYTQDPQVGGRCHRRRVRLEMSLDAGLRRRWYVDLAKLGMGRNALFMARWTR